MQEARERRTFLTRCGILHIQSGPAHRHKQLSTIMLLCFHQNKMLISASTLYSSVPGNNYIGDVVAPIDTFFKPKYQN